MTLDVFWDVEFKEIFAEKASDFQNEDMKVTMHGHVKANNCYLDKGATCFKT